MPQTNSTHIDGLDVPGVANGAVLGQLREEEGVLLLEVGVHLGKNDDVPLHVVDEVLLAVAPDLGLLPVVPEAGLAGVGSGAVSAGRGHVWLAGISEITSRGCAGGAIAATFASGIFC